MAASSEQLTTNSEQASQAGVITEVATGAINQLKAIDETTNIVEQLSAGIEEVAANAGNVAATIEAARVGEQGRGFAIVAEKCGNWLINRRKRLNK